MRGPLEGLRVIDLSHALAGPYCTMILADLGADVIKVENPEGGDQARSSMGAGINGADSVGFLAINRNKRSMVIDLKDEIGRSVFFDLIATADVVVENFRPGVTRRLGIDYQSLRNRNDRIVYASISGFGQTGPWALRAGYDLIAQAMSGIMSVTGEPGGRPVKCGVPISDLSAGLFCATAVLAAYVDRLRSGVGQHIDVSLFESALALSVWETATLWATGEVPGPLGSAHRLSAPYQALKTADGYVTVGANNARLWGRFCNALGRSELVDDSRFQTNELRLRNIDLLVEELESTMSQKPTAYWMECLTDVGVPAAPILNYQESTSTEHVQARKMVIEVRHPVEGTVRALGVPMKFSHTPCDIYKAAPLLGADTETILEELGYSHDQISAFVRQSTVDRSA